MKFALHSLRQRVFAGVLLTTVSALLIAGSVIVIKELSNYRERIIQDMTSQADLMGFASTPALLFNDQKLGENNLALLKARPQILSAAIYSPSGKLFATYRRNPSANNDFPEIPGADDYRIQGDRLHLFRRIVADGEIVGTVYLEAHYRVREILWQQAVLMLSAMGVALVISMLLSLWLQARLTGPILKIARLAHRIARERDYALRAEKTTDDEIGTLADAFNDLVAEVERSKNEMRRSSEEMQRQIEDRRQAELEVQRLNEELEQRVNERTDELERANKELEAFSYSVSHDLRAPLRAIDGFSQALLEDYANDLDATGKNYLGCARSAAQRMGRLIDDLLKLSRINRAEFHRSEVDLSAMVEEVLDELCARHPEQTVVRKITSGLTEDCDPQLVRIALENILGNAMKYSGKREQTAIEFGMRNYKGKSSYFIQDNGVGFEMKYADKLFGAFQRLHSSNDYPGTGIGLATVQRIVHRHGGEVWAESALDRGSTFYFTLKPEEPR
ncbi:MAG TPA: ATP-binding protein [Gammaproteobacteria bacterium]